MTFLPVNAMPEPEPSTISLDGRLGTQPASALLPSQTSSVSCPDPPLRPDAGHLNSEGADCEVTSLTPTTSTPAQPSMSPPPLSLSLSATPFLSLAAESDTDTDTYTDTDGESDAPSTSTVASSVPSPPCEFEDGPELADLKIGKEFASTVVTTVCIHGEIQIQGRTSHLRLSLFQSRTPQHRMERERSLLCRFSPSLVRPRRSTCCFPLQGGRIVPSFPSTLPALVSARKFRLNCLPSSRRWRPILLCHHPPTGLL